jgi:hypothetical protein
MAKVPLITRPWWSTDAFSVDQAATELIDGMLEQKPGGGYLLRKRPGLKEVCNPATNSAGQGCHYSEVLDAFFFVSDGKLWKYTEDAVTVTLVGSGLSSTNTIIFAEGQNLDSTTVIYLADGATLHYTDGITLSSPADPGAPATVSFVAWFSNRFIANLFGTSKFYATGVNPLSSEFDNYYWSGAWNPFVAEQKGDDITFIGAYAGELWVGGEEGIEIWQDDGVTPLFPVPSAFLETGVAAPKSMTRIDMAVYGLVKLQGELMVCRFTGRNPTPISQSIGRPLNEIVDYSDAIGYHVFSKGSSFYVLTFPTEGVTWAWDIKAEYWAKWGKWNSETGDYDTFIAQYSAYASKWGKYLVQSRSDSRIYAVDRDYLYDAGYTLRTSYKSATIDHGTIKRKRCNELRMQVKPIMDIDTGDHTLELRWQDDGRSEWSNTIQIGLGSADLREQYVHIKRMGIYRSRKYNFILGDYSDLLVGDSEIDVEALRD